MVSGRLEGSGPAAPGGREGGWGGYTMISTQTTGKPVRLPTEGCLSGPQTKQRCPRLWADVWGVQTTEGARPLLVPVSPVGRPAGLHPSPRPSCQWSHGSVHLGSADTPERWGAGGTIRSDQLQGRPPAPASWKGRASRYTWGSQQCLQPQPGSLMVGRSSCRAPCGSVTSPRPSSPSSPDFSLCP